MVEKKIETTIYVADDGIQFDNSLDCMRHELYMPGNSEWMLSGDSILCPIFRAWDECSSHRGALLVRLQSERDEKYVKMFLELETECNDPSDLLFPSSYPYVGLLEWDGNWVTFEDVDAVYKEAYRILRRLFPYINPDKKVVE